MDAVTRFIIIGTGAIGGVIGGALAQAGLPVVWVARGEHGRTLASQGMTLHTPGGTLRPRAPVWSGPDEASLTADDVLVLAVKTQAAGEALASWCDARLDDGRRAGDALPVLVCTNGLEAERLALRYARRVYGVCVWCPATHLTPGEISVRLAPELAALHLGRVPAVLTTDADRVLLEGIADDWRAAGLHVSLPADVWPWKRRKLLTNMFNVVDALLGPQADRAGRRRVTKALESETSAVLDAAGVAVITGDQEAAERARGPQVTDAVAGFDKASMGTSSTWQSAARGQQLETDYLNGEVVAIAHEHGLEAPLNAAVSALARQAWREGRSPGWLSAEELIRLLGLREA